jgi:superfamily II DNA/RNA helicase
LFFTGTPHRGKNYGFLALLHLLKPERFNPTEPMLEQLTYLHDTLIRNNKQNVVDMKGNKLFKPLQNTAYTYQYSLEEEYFYQQMTDFISSGKSYASTLGEQERKSVMLVLIAMQKLASSSVAAIHKALKGRLDRLKQQMTNLNQEIKKNSLNNLENIEEFDELAEKEETLYEKLFPDILTLIANEIPYLEELIKSAENIKQETKIQAILDLVEHQFSHEQILFFTEYKATQALLMSALISRYGEESATFINGDERLDNIIDSQGKIKTIHRHRSLSVTQFNEGKVRFIISTEAGGEGIDLQHNCHVLIHIDLPWNPMRLHQRVGRLNRYGQKHPVQVITIRNPETVESLIWEKLNAKLNNIMLALSEVMDEPEDLLQLVLGMTQSNFFSELFSEASLVKKESLNKWFDQKTSTFGGKNILETVKTLVGKSAQFDLQDLASIPQKDLQELQPFFETMLHLNKRRFSKENNKISFKTPEKWLVDAGIKTHYEELMFYRYLKEETKNIIGVGNRVFDLAIQQANEHDAYLTFIKKLEYPLIVFRVYDRVTETSGNIKQVFFGVLLNKQTPQVLLDWQLLEIMNTFLKDNHEKLDLDYDVSILKKNISQAKILLENQLSNFKLPFKMPEISEFAMFCP